MALATDHELVVDGDAQRLGLRLDACGPLSLMLISSALVLGDGAGAQTRLPELPPVEVVATSPLIGSALDRNLVLTADLDGNVTVQPGSRLPGIPAHQLKVGAYYKVTDKCALGTNLVAVSSAYLVGDEANLTAPLPPYATPDLTTTCKLLPNIHALAWARRESRTALLTKFHTLYFA
jgi:hypothetical protein